MHASVRLGRIRGIPVGLHSSWFLIFALVSWSLARGYFPPAYPGLPQPAYWLLGALTSLLFFLSVFLHEMGHSAVAQRNGIPVSSITLFIFGGVAQIAREPDHPGTEFRIAVAGPVVSLLLFVLFAGLYALDRQIPYLAAPSRYLANINLILALFNLIPGFPLDGGRVLRAAVWAATGDFQRATRAAAFTGQVVAFAFMGIGLFTIIGGQVFNGLWLILIGWFLQNAAAASFAQVTVQQSLRGVSVGQVMNRDCAQVPGYLPLERIVEDRVLAGGQRCFFVTDNARLLGMLTLRDLARVPREEWNRVPASQVMVPWERLFKVGPSDPLLNALKTMDDADIAQLPVVDEVGRILGSLSREEIMRYLRTRAELGV